MENKKFINYLGDGIPNIDELMISELLVITLEANNKYPTAKSDNAGYNFYKEVYKFDQYHGAEGWTKMISNLKSLGMNIDSIKKFIFAEMQIINRVAFNDENAVDAWGYPEKYLGYVDQEKKQLEF